MSVQKEIVYGGLFLFIVGLFVGFGILCNGGIKSGPERAVINYLKALENENFDEATNYWLDGSFYGHEKEILDAVSQGATVDISHIKTTLTGKNDLEAEIECSYDMELETSEGTSKVHYEGQIYMLKLGNRWLISMYDVKQTSIQND